MDAAPDHPAKRPRFNTREGLCAYPRDSEMPHEIVGQRLVASSVPGQPAVKMLSMRPLYPEGAPPIDVLKADTSSLHERFPHVWERHRCDERTDTNATLRTVHIAAAAKQASMAQMSHKAMFVELRLSLIHI